MPITHQPHAALRFRAEKSTRGGVTFLALHGVIDEGFEGQKVMAGIRTSKLVLNLREVRRFASWGMAEWMSFLRAAADRDLYLVECSAYAVNQINLVTGLLGHGKLISFYSPYRCGRCGEERDVLTLVPRDRAALRERADRERVCATCGGSARMDRYPAVMCAALAERASFDIDDEVIDALREQLAYDLSPDAARFRAYRRANKAGVYLRLSGNLAMLPPEALVTASEGTTIVDLASVVFDPAELGPWRTYLRSALAAVSSLQLLDCPPGFLDAGVQPEDLQSRLQVRSFALSYLCASCQAAATSIVEVAQHLEQLADGMVPSMRCPGCQALLAPTGNGSSALLRRLPAREHDAALDTFLARARAEPASKLEDCLVARPRKPLRGPAGVPGGLYLTSALVALAAGGLVMAGVAFRQRGAAGPAAPPQRASPPPAPAFERPDWIASDVPSSAFCHDLVSRLVCVGVSPYRARRSEALADASDAALDELVNAVGLKISDSLFRDNVLGGYSEARREALAALQSVEADRSSAAHAAADELVRKARARVVEILRSSGGPAVPAQRSDWYWEEYAAERAAGTEFLGFVRYDVNPDAVKALVERYSTTVQEGGTAMLTAFPGLAWQDGELAGGAMLTEVARPLASAGIAPQQIVTAAGDQPVIDASGLARRLEGWSRAGGNLTLTVKTAGLPAQTLELRR